MFQNHVIPQYTLYVFALKSLKNGAKIMIEFDIFDHMYL